MEGWKSWMRFKLKSSFLLPTKIILVKVTSRLRDKGKGKGDGLAKVYKDMEACGGYADIQVMWEIIHASTPSCPCSVGDGNRGGSRERLSQWRFCFRPS